MTAPDDLHFVRQLYFEELHREKDPYLWRKARTSPAILRHIEAVSLYAAHVKPDDVVLDWGCRHGTDSALLRKWKGAGLRLHGCDFSDMSACSTFKYSDLSYTKLDHEWKTPYESATFDCVISSGVLEHVACFSESLLELRRILKRDGKLIITFFPNKASYTEITAKALGRHHHQRRFTRKRLDDELLQFGFVKEAGGYHQLMPSFGSPASDSSHGNPVLRKLIDRSYRMDRVLSRTPLRLFSANLWGVYSRVDAM